MCSCLPEFIGTPPACRPECTISTECNFDKACINQKCADPCPGVCGTGAQCQVRNHAPLCSCQLGYTGDPFTRCYPIPREFVLHIDMFSFYNRHVTCTAPPSTAVAEPIRDPCLPSPCGPNSQCRNVNNQASCSCLPNFFGAPPNCRPECATNSECSSNLACINNRCTDPCPGSCAYNAQCSVINHIPICSCPKDYVGDPFVSCQPAPPRKIMKTLVIINLIPFMTLSIVPTAQPPVKDDPCNPSPCGPNAVCNDGQCTCIPEYQGDPFIGCRPECVLNSECPHDKACIRNKCVDPCPGTCGVNAICEVLNHVPMCRCPDGMSGNAFYQCDPIPRKYYFVTEIIFQRLSFSPPSFPLSKAKLVSNPCEPSPCGPNSRCRVVNQNAVCSCIEGFIGNPPTCRPECVRNSDCGPQMACQNQKCVDPCPGACGFNAICKVTNHAPICTCPARYTGNPFVTCQPISKYFILLKT